VKANTLLLAASALSLPALASAQVVEYYSLDAIGNVRVVTDQQGKVVERHDYLPFGEECTTGPCASNPGSGAGQSRKFTGKERDSETGLDYFGARYYGSKTGRFTTVDPVYTLQESLVDPQRWNRYAYGRANPLRFEDPDGRAVIEIPQATLARNAAIRAEVAEFFGMGNPNQHPHAWFGGVVADFLLGAVLPQNAQEYQSAVESSLLGMAAPMEAGPRVLANRIAGKAAEAKVAAELAAEGRTILGSQVCCNTSEGRRFIDHLTQDAGGSIGAVEVKSGNATRSLAQRTKDTEIAAGRGTFVGKNAPDGVRGTQRAVETVERKPNN
jgi:RHS repeat-associated protein